MDQYQQTPPPSENYVVVQKTINDISAICNHQKNAIQKEWVSAIEYIRACGDYTTNEDDNLPQNTDILKNEDIQKISKINNEIATECMTTCNNTAKNIIDINECEMMISVKEVINEYLIVCKNAKEQLDHLKKHNYLLYEGTATTLDAFQQKAWVTSNQELADLLGNIAKIYRQAATQCK